VACGSCGANRGHFGGCPVVDHVPVDSQISARKKQKAKNEAAGTTKCPPHDWYKLASGREQGGRKWRTDQCTKCNKKHRYYTDI